MSGCAGANASPGLWTASSSCRHQFPRWARPHPGLVSGPGLPVDAGSLRDVALLRRHYLEGQHQSNGRGLAFLRLSGFLIFFSLVPWVWQYFEAHPLLGN